MRRDPNCFDRSRAILEGLLSTIIMYEYVCLSGCRTGCQKRYDIHTYSYITRRPRPSWQVKACQGAHDPRKLSSCCKRHFFSFFFKFIFVFVLERCRHALGNSYGKGWLAQVSGETCAVDASLPQSMSSVCPVCPVPIRARFSSIFY